MKKSIFKTIAIVLALCCSAAAQAQLSGVQTAATDGLKGNVKKTAVSLYTTMWRSGEIIKGLSTDLSYDDFGIIPNAETRQYAADGSLASVESTVDGIKSKFVYTHSGGKVATEKRYDSGKLLSESVFTYDATGNLANTKTTTYYEGSDPYTAEYPATAKNVKKNADGTVTEYGENGADYTIRDAAGKVLKTSVENEMDGYTDVRTYTYDNEGRLTKLAVDGVGTYDYKYVKADPQGNWTEMVVYRDGKAYRFVTRTVLYY